VKESVKHRFIGAAVLAAIAVLFLPGFFKDRQAYDVDTSSHIPQRPSITAVSFDDPEDESDLEVAPPPETMFLPDESEALVVPVAAIEPRSDADALAELVAKVGRSSSSPFSSAPSSLAAIVVDELAEMPLNAQGLPDAWVVQVASLSTQAAAMKLRDQLQVDGYKAYVRSVAQNGASIHRVFIGPKLDKAQALSLKSELDKRLKVNSMVLPFKP
jgi:DedD protein